MRIQFLRKSSATLAILLILSFITKGAAADENVAPVPAVPTETTQQAPVTSTPSAPVTAAEKTPDDKRSRPSSKEGTTNARANCVACF